MDFSNTAKGWTSQYEMSKVLTFYTTQGALRMAEAIRTTVVPIRILIRTTVVPITPLMAGI